MKFKATGALIGFYGACALSVLSIASCRSDDQVGEVTNVTPQSTGGVTPQSTGGVTPQSTGGNGVIILPNMGGMIASSGGSTSVIETPTETANCGVSNTSLTKQDADLLIVLDRSSSMTWDIAKSQTECNPAASPCKQRWATTTSALNTVLSSPVAADISWGLKLFASDNACAVTSAMEVPIAGQNADKVRQAITIQKPGSYTPTRLVINAATAYLKTVNNGHTKSILLATDGEPNCASSSGGSKNQGSPDIAGTIFAITAAKAAGFRVYVIGIGPEAMNLDIFAKAGGTDRFYPASTPETLASALQSIIGQVASCSYTLGKAPPDPNNIGVYLDKKLVPKDGVNGWTLAQGNQTVVFSGSYCEGIKNEAYQQIDVLFGCPGVDIPIVIP